MSLKRKLARAWRRLTGPLPRLDFDAVMASPAFAAAANRYFYLGADLALVRLRSGETLYVDPQDEHVSANIIVHGYWEAEVHAVVMSLLKPGARVIEVGANVGYYTVTMAARVGPDGFVTALEANPRMVGLVRRSLRFNGLGARARVVEGAASDHAGTLEFITSRTNSGGGYVSIWDHTPYEDAVRLEVQALRLDNLGEDRVDLIRIDAEGSEAFILRGAERLLRANPEVVICMEWSVIQIGSRTSVADFLDWMSGLGFRFWRIGPSGELAPVSVVEMAGLEPCDVVAARRPPQRAPG